MANVTIFSIQAFDWRGGELIVSAAKTAKSAVAATVEAIRHAEHHAGCAAVAVTRRAGGDRVEVTVLWSGGEIPDGWLASIEAKSVM